MDFRRSDEWSVRVGDAVDAAVDVVAEWIAGAVLHVADEYVVPVDDVERAVGGELHVDGAEVAVGAGEQVVAVGAFVAGAVVGDLVLFGAEEADGVVDEDVALDVVGEVAAGDELEAGGGADAVGVLDEVGRVGGKLAVADVHGALGHPAEVGVGGVGKERLSPFVEGGAPRVGDGEAGGAFEVLALWAVAEEAAVGGADGAVGGFDVAVEEGAFAHVDGAGRVGAEGADDVVGVVVVEAAEDDFSGVGAVVAVGVLEEDEVGSLGDIDAFGSELEAGGEVEVVGEDGFFVGATVRVGVFEDDEFVVWFPVAGFVVWVGRHGGDPEAAAVVEGHLDGVGEVGETRVLRRRVRFCSRRGRTWWRGRRRRRGN